MHRRDVLLSASSLLLGGVLGAWLTVGAAGRAFAPAPWFWAGFWFLMAASVALLVWLGADAYREHRFHRSEALTLSFDSTDRLCNELQHTKKPRPVLERSVFSTASESTFRYREPATQPLDGFIRIVRLRVANQRPKWVRNAVVELVEQRDSEGRSHPHTGIPLRWRHDDDPPFVLSTHGAPCGPGFSSHMYVDLLSKIVGRKDFRVQVANDELRRQDVADGVYSMLLATSARDEDTGRRTPIRHQAFAVTVSNDGSVTVLAHEPADLGFKL